MNKNKKENIDLTQFRYRPLKFLWFVMKQKKLAGIATFVFAGMAAVLQAGLFLVIKNLTNLISESNSTNSLVVLQMVGVLVATMISINILYKISDYINSWWITHMKVFAGQISFNYLLKHSAGYFSDRLSGKLQNKINNIAVAMDALTGKIVDGFFTLFIKLAIFILYAFIANKMIGAASLILIGVITIYSIIAASGLAKAIKIYAKQGAITQGIMIDIIANILATKQNVAIKKEEKYTQKVLDKYRKVHLHVWWRFNTVSMIGNFLAAVMFGAVVGLSVYYWQLGLITVGDVMLFITMLLTLYGNLEALGSSINYFIENKGKLQEGLEEIFAPHEIQDLPGTKKIKIKKGEIVFDKVNFHYEDDKKNTVFKNLSLTIPAGQKIGLVGESGAGKSTFVSLLLRFMDVENGSIRIDGHAVNKIRQDDLRSAIAYVPQDALLFHRSLLDNIKYSYPRATRKEIERASKRAHALEFINSFPKGFKTLVGERGVKLSGGQKQRVMIARAMLKKSPILVLDEATSALDSKAEQKIQEALESLMKGRTTIAIAHRLSTLKQMDRIIVFENGRIIEDGTHNELLRLKGKYWELWQHQS